MLVSKVIKPPTILALTGRRYVGKSFIADMVMGMDKRFVRRSFADVLKKMFAEERGIPLTELYTSSDKDKYRTELFAYADMKKVDNPMFFAQKVVEASLRDAEHGDLTVIDDLRFIEELQLLVTFGAFILKVQSDYGFRRQRGFNPDPLIDENYSETEMDISAEIFHHITGGRADQVFNNEHKNREAIEFQVAGVLNKWFPRPPGELSDPERVALLSQ